MRKGVHLLAGTTRRLTKKLKTDDELRGLVYSLTPKVQDDSKHWYQKPEGKIIFSLTMTLHILNMPHLN